MKFLKAFLVFLRMYRDGFFFSASTHVDSDKTRWGFYRFNHRNQASIFDIDFSRNGKDHNFAHVHGDEYRFEFDRKGNASLVNVKVWEKRGATPYHSTKIHHI